MAAIRAKFGDLEFWAVTWTGPDSRRIAKHQGYGRYGVVTEDTGSDGRHEQIKARMTPTEYERLREIVHTEKAIKVFTHPILGSWRARCNIMDRSGIDDPDYIEAQLEFIEDTEQPLASPYDDETPEARRNAAKSEYDDTEKEMSGTPGNDDTAELYTDYQTAANNFFARVDAYEDGAGDWQDVEQALGLMRETGMLVVNDLDAFETYQENGAFVARGIMRTLDQAGLYASTIRQSGIKWFSVKATAPTDLWTLSDEVLSNYDHIDEIWAKNTILDPFFIEAGTILEFPVP